MADDKGLSAQQIKTIQDGYTQNIGLRQQAVIQAVTASSGKDWTAKAVADLAEDFYKFWVKGIGEGG